MDFRREETISAVSYPSKEEVVDGKWVRNEKKIYASDMIATMDDKRRLLQMIMDKNPHLHYSWETADNYLWWFETAQPDNAARMEIHMINILELRNTGWTFSEAKYYNPYWKMTKEEFDAYAEEMNKIYSDGKR